MLVKVLRYKLVLIPLKKIVYCSLFSLIGVHSVVKCVKSCGRISSNVLEQTVRANVNGVNVCSKSSSFRLTALHMNLNGKSWSRMLNKFMNSIIYNT